METKSSNNKFGTNNPVCMTNYAPPCKGRGKGVGLLSHYFTIALRNLHRFRLQSIVCITGLAVGMTCFALGTLWLRYIESFEDFIPDAENVYFATQGRNATGRGYDYFTNRETGQDMLDSIPAVTDFCTIAPSPYGLYDDGRVAVSTDGGREQRLRVMLADSSFFRFFGIEAEEGTLRGFQKGDVILTRSTARSLFGDTIALGQEIRLDRKNGETEPRMVRAIVPDAPQNTQFAYDVLMSLSGELQDNHLPCCYTFVRLNPKAELDSLVGKPISLTVATPIENMPTVVHIRHLDLTLTPVTRLRSDYPTAEVDISTEYVRWFMALGLLVIVCSLFNYIITMVSHLRRRGWEFSLRRVLGSSRVHILYMVALEALLTFLFATLLAVLLTWLVLPAFREYSGIDIAWNAMARRLATYLALVIVSGMALSALTAWLVMYRVAPLPAPPRGRAYSVLTRSAVISPPRGSGEGGFGVLAQLALSMGIIFALVVMLRQVNMLMYSDQLGFSHNDMGVVRGPSEELKQRIEQSPLTDEVLDMNGSDVIFPRTGKNENGVFLNEDRRDRHINHETVLMDSAIARFFGFQLVTGELPVAKRYAHMGKVKHEMVGICFKNGVPEYIYQDYTRYPMEVCINEAMCRELGHTPERALGTRLYNAHDELRVCGVLRDQYTQGCVVPPGPVIYYNTHDDNLYHDFGRLTQPFAFRARPGRAAELCDSIRQWLAAEGTTNSTGLVFDSDVEFGKFITSERMLIKILMAVGLASLFVCTIGTFSLVSLALQRRRKEIAIRKVHGARLKDILRLFLKSQIVSLCIAALVAYPIAYIIMKHWLEGYQKQVTISWWLIPATLLGIAAVVLSTITLKIWRAARESTVEALK